ncbi:hypothetical protein EAF04_006373 [Stromatinia cepivora]|nr:hypothetical protein EAF04_006373 [Stromatinia cepivora]
MSMDVPPDQNTAPVLEFRCLYTADTRRKQKRWQDGRLKYHTFNKRVMVFDERANLVGDAHWREKASLDEGAELELERNGILVEVSEFIERRDQDLTELIDKRVKEREERFIARNGDSSPARFPASIIRSQSIAAAHLKPKPLNSILGTPSGHYGKALIPNTSPFEQRQMLNASHASENDSPRSTKRRKANEPLPNKISFAQNLIGATLSFTPTPLSTGPMRYESLKLKSIQQSESNDNKENGDSNEATPSSREQSLIVGMARNTNPFKSRIQAQKRDKPVKSGYANNLTGASLLLTPFREAISRNMETNSVVQKNQPATIDLSMDPSSDEDTHPAPVPKLKEAVGKKKKRPLNLSEQISRLSSPPSGITPGPRPAAKESSKRQESQNISSPLNQLPERSHSSLRIKSRPRNKMLMFMDQPSPRSSALAMEHGTNSSINSGAVIPSAKPYSSSRSYLLTTEQETAKSTKLDPASPVAKVSSPHASSISNDANNDLVNDYGNNEPHISAFPKELNLGDFEEPFSSPADIGIGHQLIDAILSRNRPPEAQRSKPNAASSLIDQGKSVHKQQRRSSNIGDGSRHSRLEYLSSLNDKVPQIVEEHAQDHEYHLPKHLPEASGTTRKRTSNAVEPHKDATSYQASTTKASETRSESNVRPSLAEGGMTAVSEPTYKPNTESIITSDPAEKIGSAVEAPTSVSCALQQTLVIPKATTHPNIAGKSKTKNLVPNTVTIPKADGESAVGIMHGAGSNIIELDKLLVDITSNGSTFNATGRFMAKIMPTPNQHRVETVPIKMTSSLIGQPSKFPPAAQSSSNNVEVKQSPSSIPDFIPVAKTRSDETSGFMPANQVIEKDAQSYSSEAPNPRDHGLRPRIINPATRGMSIKKTAKTTLHALVPAVNHMGPPAAISGGGGSGRDATNNTLGNPGHETGGKGPWSRESFDLFGSWRRPVQQS